MIFSRLNFAIGFEVMDTARYINDVCDPSRIGTRRFSKSKDTRNIAVGVTGSKSVRTSKTTSRRLPNQKTYAAGVLNRGSGGSKRRGGTKNHLTRRLIKDTYVCIFSIFQESDSESVVESDFERSRSQSFKKSTDTDSFSLFS